MSQESIDELQAERDLLGSLLLDEDRISSASELLAASDFEDPRHRSIYRAILAVHQRSAPVNFVTVLEELKSFGLSAEECSPAYLVEISQAITTSTHAPYLARIVAERSDRRRLARRLEEAQREVEATGAGNGLIYGCIDRLKAELPAPRAAGVPLGSIDTVCLADVESKPIRWLWPGRIALGKLTLLAGDPGLGKSTLALDIAARVTRGATWPDVADVSDPARVLIVTAEDALDDTVRPRLEAANARLENIDAIKGVGTRDGARTLSLEADLRALKQKVMELEGLRLLVIDPVSAFLGATDSHKNSDVRGILAPLSALAEKFGLAVLAVTHLNKAQSAAIYRALGSIAFVAAARAAWFIVKDKQDPSRRLLLQGKNNLGSASGLAFRVDSAGGPAGTSVPVIAWETGTVDVGLDEALAPLDGGCGSELGRACEFLRSELAGGPMPEYQLRRGSRANDISDKTLNRAKKELGVEAKKGGFSGGWSWALPEDGQADVHADLATFEEVGHLRPEGAENGALIDRSGLNGSEDGQGNRVATFDGGEVGR